MMQQVLAGVTNPGLDFCRGVSRAFGIPMEDVLRLAGILPPKPVIPAQRPLRVRETGVTYEAATGDLDVLLAAWEDLSPAGRELVLDLAQRLATIAPRIIGEEAS